MKAILDFRAKLVIPGGTGKAAAVANEVGERPVSPTVSLLITLVAFAKWELGCHPIESVRLGRGKLIQDIEVAVWIYATLLLIPSQVRSAVPSCVSPSALYYYSRKEWKRLSSGFNFVLSMK